MIVTRKVWLGFFLWHLLNLHLHLLFMSHGTGNLSLYISTPYIYIYTLLLCYTKNYSKWITKRDIQWCSSPKPLALLLVILWAHVLGLGHHLGLGLHVKNTNRKNFKFFGPWPFLLLMASLFSCWDDPSSIASLIIFMCFWITSGNFQKKLWMWKICRHIIISLIWLKNALM